MDKFVVRNPRGAARPANTSAGRKKQATLESLRGVVIIEDLQRAKVVLERTDTPLQLKVETLKTLGSKTPSREVLLKTQIGKTVHKLCRAKDDTLAAAARATYKVWKQHVLSKVNRPTIEVACDAKTENCRRAARHMLLEGLQKGVTEGLEGVGASEEGEGKGRKGSHGQGKEEGNGRDMKGEGQSRKEAADTELENLAEYIEREVYHRTKRLLTKAYKRTIRSLVFCLRHQSHTRQAVTSSSLAVPELVKQHLKT